MCRGQRALHVHVRGLPAVLPYVGPVQTQETLWQSPAVLFAVWEKGLVGELQVGMGGCAISSSAGWCVKGLGVLCTYPTTHIHIVVVVVVCCLHSIELFPPEYCIYLACVCVRV